MTLPLSYDPTLHQENTQGFYGQHHRLSFLHLPEISFFSQTVVLPSVIANPPVQPNPFAYLPLAGDRLVFGPLTMTFQIDAKFRNYFSLLFWMRGYGFPEGYDDLSVFQRQREDALSQPNPTVRQINTTTALLQILYPDTDAIAVEFEFRDVTPTHIGEITLDTTVTTATHMTCTASFTYSTFGITKLPL